MRAEAVPSDDEEEHVQGHDETWMEYFHVLLIRYFPIDSRPWIVGDEYCYEDRKNVVRSYKLDSWMSRVFVILELSESCKLATYIYQFVMCVIIVNIIANVMMSLPAYRDVAVSSCANPACNDNASLCPGYMICEPQVDPSLNVIDDVCVIIFTIEYGIRVLTVASTPNRLAGLIPRGFDEEERIFSEMENRKVRDPPPLPWYRTVYGYCITAKNLIDFVAILPFYITLIDPGNSASLSFIRILRLFRVLRAFNGGANTGVINMIGKTVKSSMEIIIFVLMIMALVIFIYGSIIFSLESGTFIVNEEYPTGAYLVKDAQGDYSKTALTSTFIGMYWAVVTMTTVGYGDIIPYTDMGKLVAVTCAFIGVLFMALPIAILGSKVTLEYAKLEGKAKVEKEQRRLAIVERKLSMSGKGSMSSKSSKQVRERLKSRTASLNEQSSRIKDLSRSKGSTMENKEALKAASAGVGKSGGGGGDDGATSTAEESRQLVEASTDGVEYSLDDSFDGGDEGISVKKAMRNLVNNQSMPTPADQRKLNAAIGEIEARTHYEENTGGPRRGGLFGARNSTKTDAMELVINRLIDDLLDEDAIISSKDRHVALEELTRHLKSLSDTVMTDLESDYRRMQLLVSSSQVLLDAASHSRAVTDAISEAVEEEVDG